MPPSFLFSHNFTQAPHKEKQNIIQSNHRRTREIGGTRRRQAESAFPLASFSQPKGRVSLDTIRRLVEAGIGFDCALETVAWFRQQGDDQSLERYIQQVETCKSENVCLV